MFGSWDSITYGGNFFTLSFILRGGGGFVSWAVWATQFFRPHRDQYLPITSKTVEKSWP